jgi:hypothetical protein
VWKLDLKKPKDVMSVKWEYYLGWKLVGGRRAKGEGEEGVNKIKVVHMYI